ncbi:hypothetical protein [Embleya sp. MST-111070]|uniref:hypothetical protein n=1 Tax=Embleya sp. MST-111070 TaxID=3398231 RepID=UPI003F733EC0
MSHAETRYAARLAAYVAVATRLSLLSDRRLGEIGIPQPTLASEPNRAVPSRARFGAGVASA